MCEGGGGRSGVALGAGGGGERSPGARGGGGLSRRRSGAGPARACDCGERGGAGPCAKCCLRSTTPPVFPGWAGPRLGGLALACWGEGTAWGVSRLWLRGAAGRGREVRLPPPSRDPVGRRGSMERRCHSPWSSSPFRGFPPPWQVRRGSGKPAVRSGWESRRLDLPRPTSLWGGRGPQTANCGDVRAFSCGSAMPFAWGTRVRCQSCCVCFSWCSMDGTMQPGQWDRGPRPSPLGCNYWGEVLKVLSLQSAVECCSC